jgi:hypothetical protein
LLLCGCKACLCDIWWKREALIIDQLDESCSAACHSTPSHNEQPTLYTGTIEDADEVIPVTATRTMTGGVSLHYRIVLGVLALNSGCDGTPWQLRTGRCGVHHVHGKRTGTLHRAAGVGTSHFLLWDAERGFRL